MPPEHPQPKRGARAVEGRSEGWPVEHGARFIDGYLPWDGCSFPSGEDVFLRVGDESHVPTTFVRGHKSDALKDMVESVEALDVLTVETMSAMSPYAIDGLLENARAALRRWKGE